ncbi:MAG: rod shape-determining protein, partial [Lachnospiraceae bacterium]|nr:rod shape-determining protein [Lachnospiraceae bacterium]
RNGIYLTGGASQVEHLAEMIEEETGLKVNLDDEPLGSVAKGLATVIREPKFHSLAYSIENK